MPKVRRKHVPRAAIEHLARRVRERYVPVEDLQSLAQWLDTDPTVSSGRWFKRFSKIIVCGEGELVKTILEDSHSAVGSEVE
jgi:hypothetical protein